MKKTLSVLLALLLIVFCGCKASNGTEDTSDHVSDTSENTASNDVTPASEFEYEEVEDGIAITKYTGDHTSISIPETIDGKTVTEIRHLYFYDVTSLRMPDTVLRIADHAFDFFGEYAALKNVHFSSGLLSIGSRAFYRCTGLESIELPESLESIGSQAFEHCTSLKEVTIPKNVVEIGDEAFWCCPLEKITFAEDGRLESIGYAAFAGTEVTELTIPSSVRYLYGASLSSSTLEKVTLHEGLQIISNHAFVGTALTEVVVPASVTIAYFDSFFYLDEDKKLKVYFEGDLPDDFFEYGRFHGLPEDFCVTLYHHEGAKGFDIADEHITILTW